MSPGINITALDKSVPTVAPGITTNRLAPVAQAGVTLAIAVLSITGGSILILAAALVLSEVQSAGNIKSAYSQALADVSRSSPDTGRGALLLAQLRRARADGAWNLEATALKEAQTTLQSIQNSPDVTSDQKATLKGCLPISTDPSTRNSNIDKCSDVIGSLSTSQDGTGSRVRAIVELAKQAGDQQQAFRTFWVQAAQLILLNLLLPLMTALLGYIFGTAQTQKVA